MAAMPAVLRCALALFLVGTLVAPCAMAEDPELAAGVRQVDEGDFEGAIVTLEPVVRRLGPAGGHDAAQACLYLGIAHLALDQTDRARALFREALDHDPGLKLGADRFSPKILSAFEDARRERDAAAAASRPTAPERAPARKGGHGRALLLAGAGVAVGVGVAVAASGGSSSGSTGGLQFSAARFAPQAIECADGSIDLPIGVGIDIDTMNGGAAVTVTSVSSVLIVTSSPALPGEVGFASAQSTTVSPTAVPTGMFTLHVQTTLRCSNGTGDASRFNEWTGRVTLATAQGAFTVETVDRLRVNIP
jgi:hypothetical protein